MVHVVLPHSIIIQLYTINTYAISVCNSGREGMHLIEGIHQPSQLGSLEVGQIVFPLIMAN